MGKYCVLLLSVALLAAPAGRAETVVMRADWKKARVMLTQGEFRPKIGVELKLPQRVKGKFIKATGEGLQVLFRGEETRFPREDIRRLRLVPRKANRTKNRRMGLLTGIPAGFVAGVLLAKASACRGSECYHAGVHSVLKRISRLPGSVVLVARLLVCLRQHPVLGRHVVDPFCPGEVESQGRQWKSD